MIPSTRPVTHPSPPPTESRGRDAADLARLRERLADHEQELAAIVDRDLDLDAERRAEARSNEEAVADVEAAARELELQNSSRLGRIIAQQAAVGLGTYALVSVVRLIIDKVQAKS